MTSDAPAADPLLHGAVIVFDLDGTLVETAPDLAGTLNHLLEREGVRPLPYDQARLLIGHGARALLRRGFEAAGQPLSPERLEALFEDFIAHYRTRIARDSRPFPGLIAALDALSAAGAVLAVCTNKRTDLSVQLLRELGLERRFAAIVGPDLAPAAKPDGRHLLTALALAGGTTDPRRAVMVGDSASDAGAARNAGTGLILVDFGYTETPADQLGGDALISHFDELVDACRQVLAAARRMG